MSISQESIQIVKEVADILEVISDFVQLKKKGQSYFGLSPFQQEKTPSFSVSPSRGIFKDFSSGKAGDAITFIMEHERMSYLEAIRYLANKYGIELEETESTDEEKLRSTELDSLYIALNFAKEYYKEQLNDSRNGKAIAKSYFKEREITQASIEKFELGYSQDEWDAFLKHAKSQQFSEEILEKAGLIIKKEEKTYDRFRARVIFPIHNIIGKVVGFGARTLSSDKNQPKYINSPETAVYNKSKELYGFYFAKNEIRNKDNCILVEGYTDVISLNQAGIENVIASSGTSLTEDQVKIIKRFTNNLTLLFDGDKAGLNAAERGVRLVLAAGMNLKVVTLPEGKDPDSYVREIGAESFIAFLDQNKQDFLTFKTKVQLGEIKGEPFKKAELIKEIVAIIALIPDAITRSVYFKECGTILDIDEQILIAEFNKGLFNERRNKLVKEKYQRSDRENQDDPVEKAYAEISSKPPVNTEQHELEVLKYLIKFSNIFVEPDNKTIGEYILDSVKDVEFQNVKYAEILEIFRQYLEKNEYPEVKDFLNNEAFESVKNTVIDIISEKYTVSENWEKQNIFVPAADHDLGKRMTDDINRLKWKKIRELKDGVREELKKMSEDHETEEHYIKLLKYFNELKSMEKEISRVLGNVIS